MARLADARDAGERHAVRGQLSRVLAEGHRGLAGMRCPTCRGPIDTDLRCGSCGRRFALVPSDDPVDAEARLMARLADARDAGERHAVRGQLSRVLAESYRGDLLLALWIDERGPEADLWRGAAAVIAQPEGSDDPVAPLERALAAFLADGRRDLVAVARAYLIQAYQTVMRIDDAVRVGDAALAAALEERDGAACVRASSTRYLHIEYELRRNYRQASGELARIADLMRSWAPAQSAVVGMMRAQVMLLSDPQGARAIVAGLPPPDATTRAARVRQAHRFAATEAVLAHDRDAAEAALAALTRVTPSVGYSELPIFVALCRAWLALIHGEADVALREARAAMPPDWHRACPRRRESRLAVAEALALVTAQLRAVGVGRPRSGSLGRLTPRETEIARLIGRGATNGDIAAALVLSEATVARHVSNILLKLDIPNRRAIAERLGAEAEPT